MRQKAWLLIHVLAVMIAVLIGSLMPSGLGWSPVRPPELAHFLAYGTLGFLLVAWAGARAATLFWVVAGLAALGFLIELAQIPIPNRTFLWVDALANAIGALLGALAAWFLARVIQRLHRSQP